MGATDFPNRGCGYDLRGVRIRGFSGAVMSFRRLGLVALTGVGLLSLPSLTGCAVARADTEDVPFYVMGGSGLPTPSQDLIDTLQQLYFPSVANFTGQPTFSNVDPVALTTPEQFYPVTGVYQETLANSV